MAWKVCLNVLDHSSAVATKTRALVDAAKAVDPQVEVLTTRKSMPGAKDLLTKAVMAGGAYPHRLGLSETVLVFDQHLTFFGGFEAFSEQVPVIRRRCIEKKLFVEADAARAVALARAGVDGVQVDKVAPGELRALGGRAARDRSAPDDHCGRGHRRGQCRSLCRYGSGRPGDHGSLHGRAFFDMSAKMERLPG